MSDLRWISDTLVPWLDQVLDESAASESTRYEIGIMPGQDGVPALGVVLWSASPILGQALTSVMMIGNPLSLTEDEVKAGVRSIVEQIRQQRHQMLSGANGHGTPGAGLIT